jgi:hypothetical protein
MKPPPIRDQSESSQISQSQGFFSKLLEIRVAVFIRYQKQLDCEVEQGFVLAHCLNAVLLLGLKRRSIVIAHKYPTYSVDMRVASCPLCGLL